MTLSIRKIQTGHAAAWRVKDGLQNVGEGLKQPTPAVLPCAC